MADRKTRKQVAQVLRKYVGTTNLRTLGSEGFLLVSVFGVAAAIDVAMGGGLSTLLTVAVGGGGAIDMARTAHKLAKLKFVENKAGQRYEARFLVINTLSEMEAQLRIAFNRASAPEASHEVKDIFKRVAQEIANDAHKLSPAFKILAGGPYGFGTDRFEFVVSEKIISPGHIELITLNQAMKNFGEQIVIQQEEKKIPEKKTSKLKLSFPKPPKVTVNLKKPQERLKKFFRKPW